MTEGRGEMIVDGEVASSGDMLIDRAMGLQARISALSGLEARRVELDATIARLSAERDGVDGEMTDIRSEMEHVREGATKEDLFALVIRLSGELAHSRALLRDGDVQATPPGAAVDGGELDGDRSARRAVDNERLFFAAYRAGYASDPEKPDPTIPSKGWTKAGYLSGREDASVGVEPDEVTAYVRTLINRHVAIPPEYGAVRDRILAARKANPLPEARHAEDGAQVGAIASNAPAGEGVVPPEPAGGPVDDDLPTHVDGQVEADPVEDQPGLDLDHTADDFRADDEFPG